MNQLKTKIEEVKAKLGLTQMQLSERIGKNPHYLDTVKHRGVTTERQNELMLELDLVANGGEVITERKLMADLSEQLVEAQDKAKKAQAAIEALKEENSAIKAVNSVAIKDRNELQRKVVLLAEYKHQHRDLVAIMIVVGIISILGFALWSAM